MYSCRICHTEVFRSSRYCDSCSSHWLQSISRLPVESGKCNQSAERFVEIAGLISAGKSADIVSLNEILKNYNVLQCLNEYFENHGDIEKQTVDTLRDIFVYVTEKSMYPRHILLNLALFRYPAKLIVSGSPMIRILFEEYYEQLTKELKDEQSRKLKWNEVMSVKKKRELRF